MKIVLTGATGFLGSHIAEALVNEGYEVLATKRTTSQYLTLPFSRSVSWVNTDDNDWEEQICLFSPEIIIHAAWVGVDASNRDDWAAQLANIHFMGQLLNIASKCHILKFVSLGSQAEYGQFSGKINEYYPVHPTSAYGAVKLSVLEMLRSFASIYHFEWYWLRVFTVFGERESDKWLIPSLITRMLNKETYMDCTKGEQVYSYLYVRDFASAINKVIKRSTDNSGVYNLSSNAPMQLVDLLTQIRDAVSPSFAINFGALAYRANQAMHIEGDITKFESTFGEIKKTEFAQSLAATINYYKERSLNETI